MCELTSFFNTNTFSVIIISPHRVLRILAGRTQTRRVVSLTVCEKKLYRYINHQDLPDSDGRWRSKLGTRLLTRRVYVERSTRYIQYPRKSMPISRTPIISIKRCLSPQTRCAGILFINDSWLFFNLTYFTFSISRM